MQENIHAKTVDDFGKEWTIFNHASISHAELEKIFAVYFKIFPWEKIPKNATGFDMGCGSGRWAKFVAPRVGRLYCIDASAAALKSAKGNLCSYKNVDFMNDKVSSLSLENDSMDFCYSLGVLHHIPDTFAGIQSCVQKLKKGAPFLVYLYYNFDNKPFWYRHLWSISNLFRQLISRFPYPLKYSVSQALALFIYYPLARSALVLQKLGFNVDHWPLSNYKERSFYIMRNDSLDRFGTRLEKRFTKIEIKNLMLQAGLKDIVFSSQAPYWCALGYKK